MKNCVIFFDISKAFDKVWHDGLLFKMINHKFDKYIISWVNEFLNEKKFSNRNKQHLVGRISK